jgi:hypothetical protein
MRAAEVGLREGGQWNGCSRLDMMRSDAALDQPIAACDRPSSVWLCPRTSKSGLSPLADNSRIDFTVQPGVTKRRRRADPIPSVWRFHRTCFSLRVEQPPLPRQLPRRLSSLHGDMFLSVLVLLI